MNITKARQAAKLKSRGNNETIYVVYDPSYRDNLPEDSYWVADDVDCETWFAGAKIIAAYSYGWES